MQVFIRYLYEDAPRIGQEFFTEDQAVTEVREVGMDAEGPGIAVGLDHLRLPGEVAFLVLHVPFPDFRLEVGGKFNPVGRVHIDHLDLSGQVLPAGKARHDLEGIAQDHPVRPVHVMLVELDGLLIFQLRVSKEIPLDVLTGDDLEDRLGADSLMNVEGDGIHLKGLLLALPRPFKPRLPVPERIGQKLRLFGG